MLVIRMQRIGRKGHAQFRVVVQDSRRTPTSGKIVAALGSYNPHTKEVKIDTERAAHFVNHGAQPSDRVAVLLQKEGVKLPKWVKLDTSKARDIKNPDKRRSTRPADETPEAVEEETPATEPAAEAAPEAEAPAEATETPAE